MQSNYIFEYKLVSGEIIYAQSKGIDENSNHVTVFPLHKDFTPFIESFTPKDLIDDFLIKPEHVIYYREATSIPIEVKYKNMYLKLRKAEDNKN